MDMGFLRSARLRRVALACLPLLVGACGCDLSLCVGGIRLRFDRTPVAPYRVDLLVNGALQPETSGTACNLGESCPQTVFFPVTPAGPVEIRITTAGGVRTTVVPELRYRNYDNGSSCGSCRYADVVALWPE